MNEARPYLWERSYPAGVRWDAPIEEGDIPALLDRAVERYGDRPAIDYRDRPISYRELGDLTRRFAGGLQRLGVGPGDAVALYLPNTPFHLLAFFGTLRTGARVAHLSPLDPERILIHKVTDSGARTIVTANFPGLVAQARKLAEAGHADRIIVGDENFWGAPPFPAEPVEESAQVLTFERFLRESAKGSPFPSLGADEIALIQYTGGTTGLPKGAMLTHGNIRAMVSMVNAWQGPQRHIEPGERVLCVLPLFHIYGIGVVMMRALDIGARVVLRARFEIEAIVRDIEEKQINIFAGVPTMWIALANFPGIEKRNLSSLKFVGSGGAPLAVEVAQRVERIVKIPMHVGWGMTETSPAGTNQPLSGSRPGSIGLPMPGIVMDVVALDDPQRVLTIREIGEIRIKGPNVFKGYWNKPEETEKSFAGEFFLTGDVGYMDEDGYFFIVDRKKDMIISGGFNVYPSMIEGAIYEHPDVEEVIVIGVPDEYRGEAAKAFVKMKQGAAPLSLEALRDFLADKLGRHELPAALEIRDSLPKTPVGKLSKKELVEEEKQKRAKAAVEVAHA